MDYLAVIAGKGHPVEVNSGPAGRLRSLHLFLQSYLHNPKGLVFSTTPYDELSEERPASSPSTSPGLPRKVRFSA